MSKEAPPPAAPKSIAPADVQKALAAVDSAHAAPEVAVDGASVVLSYPTLDAYTARTSADVEALRKQYPIAASSVDHGATHRVSLHLAK